MNRFTLAHMGLAIEQPACAPLCSVTDLDDHADKRRKRRPNQQALGADRVEPGS